MGFLSILCHFILRPILVLLLSTPELPWWSPVKLRLSKWLSSFLLADQEKLHDSGFPLKYLSRPPLNLNRIPGHLQMKIIEKQSVGAVFNLPHTNSRYCDLVDEIVDQKPYLRAIRQVLQNHKKEELMDVDGVVEWCEHVELFPPSEYAKRSKGSDSLADWSWDVYFAIYQFFFYGLGGQELKEIVMNVASEPHNAIRENHFISELWEEQRRRALGQISLQTAPIQLWVKILEKTSAISAFRLAQMTTSAAAALDDYVQSNPSIQVMVETGHLLAGENFEYTSMKHSLRYHHYVEDSLLKVLYKYYAVMVRSLDTSLIIILAICTLTLTKIIEPSEQKTWPDFILPPSNIRYVNGEFIASPDRGEPLELTGIKAACVNTAQPEEEGAKVRKLGDTEAQEIPATTRVFNDTTPFNGTEVEEEVFRKEEFKLC